MATKKTAKKSAKSPSERGMTKAQLVGELAEKTGLTKAQVGSVFDEMLVTVGRELKGGRPVTVPGLIKITLVKKPATAARPGRNPFTGQDIMIAAKPARKVVKVRAIKALKDMA